MSCWPRKEGNKDLFGGVIKTEDGGMSWRQVFDERVRVNAAGMDPDRLKESRMHLKVLRTCLRVGGKVLK